MATATGAQLLVRMLKAEGVRHLFTLSGLHIAPIYAACVEEGIQLVDTRHEQAAAHAADATARLTRGIGVCAVTAGPGVTDALTGIANAYAANSPVLLLGGAAPSFNAGKGSLQEMEQVDLFTRITKWSDRVPAPDRVPTYLAKAFRTMLSGRPGPVFLEVPWDVLSNGVEESECPLPTAYRTRARQPGDPAFIARAAELLAAAERPVIVAGSSIHWDDAPAQLVTLAERLGAPVYLNGAGRGSLPAGHPHFFSHSRKDALAEADVVLIVGTPLDFRLGYGAGIGENARLGQVGSRPRGGPRRPAAARRGAARAARARDGQGRAASRLRALRPGAHPPLPPRPRAGPGGARRRRQHVRRRRGELGGHRRQGDPAAQAGPLARPGPAGLPRGGRALRHCGQAAPPRPARLRHPGGRELRPQRLRLRDGAALQAADGVRGGGRRGVGPDPPAASAALRAGEESRHAARAHPLRQGGGGAGRVRRACHPAGADPPRAGARRRLGHSGVRQRDARSGRACRQRRARLCHLTCIKGTASRGSRSTAKKLSS